MWLTFLSLVVPECNMDIHRPYFIYIFFYLITYLIFYLFIFNSLDLIHWINHAQNKYVNQQGSSAMIMLLHKNNTRDIDTVLWLHEFITHQTSTVFYSQNFFLSCPVFGCPGLFCYHAVTAFMFCYLISWNFN